MKPAPPVTRMVWLIRGAPGRERPARPRAAAGAGATDVPRLLPPGAGSGAGTGRLGRARAHSPERGREGDRLIRAGHRVRALDALVPQVHGPSRQRPGYLDPDVELVVGDVRDERLLVRALEDVDAVYHFAAAVGVGQSMYQVAHYTDVNDVGTARLLEALIRRPVGRLIVASSMNVYGEGAYVDAEGRPTSVQQREPEELRAGRWEPMDGEGRPLEPVPTSETEPTAPSSVYALGKYVQERMCLDVGAAYDVPTTALRFFNVFGPRQALSNPYTGVMTNFASRYLSHARPLVYEDGLQRRDFVSVHDVARACRLALETPAAAGQVLNVGSGRATTVREVADQLAQVLGVGGIEPEVTGKYRVGDVRHCFADVSRAREVLGYEPEVSLREGLEGLSGWLREQDVRDRVQEAGEELVARGLAR